MIWNACVTPYDDKRRSRDEGRSSGSELAGWVESRGVVGLRGIVDA